MTAWPKKPLYRDPISRWYTIVPSLVGDGAIILLLLFLVSEARRESDENDENIMQEMQGWDYGRPPVSMSDRDPVNVLSQILRS